MIKQKNKYNIVTDIENKEIKKKKGRLGVHRVVFYIPFDIKKTIIFTKKELNCESFTLNLEKVENTPDTDTLRVVPLTVQSINQMQLY